MPHKVFLETHNLKNKATGLGTFNYELIKGLAALDTSGLELILNIPDPSALKAEFGEKFQYHKYSSLSRHPVFRNRKPYDLWHSVNQNTKVEPFRSNRYLLTVHDVNFAEEVSADPTHRNNRLFMEKLNRATAITYISEFAKWQAHQYFAIPKLPEYVIHNGNPISTLRDISRFIPNVPVDKPYLYSIGDFLERKNFISVIEMMPLLPDFNLIISGNFEKPYGKIIRQAISQKNLHEQVFLTGKVDDVAKQFYLSNCTAFVFPSIREGFGLPPIEAMTFGKPVFLSDKTSLPEIGGDAAYYWKNFDPDYMKNILLNGISDFTADASNAARVKAHAAKFDWKTAASEYLKAYRSMLR